MASHVFLVEETAATDVIQACMKTSMQRAEEELADGAHILVYYGQTDSGKCNAQPHLRAPPLCARGEHLRSFVQNAMLRSGKANCEIDHKDIFVINDCGREGNRTALLNAFQTMPEAGAKKGAPITAKCVRNQFVILNEQSMSDRMNKVRGHSAINQVQTLLVITRVAPSLATHGRLYTEGATNRGNVIGRLANDDESSDPQSLQL